MSTPGIAVLGLGRMGAAVAGRLVECGTPIAVWNRDPARAYAFQDRARIARSAADACRDADLIVLVLSHYSAGLEVMDEVANDVDLDGRTLLQLTSGSPTDARTLQAWTRMHGAIYLDGALVAYPQTLGSAQAIVLVAGDETEFERRRPLLARLGGVAVHVGEAIGAAAALECALREYFFGATAAMLHGAALCASEQLPLTQYFQLVQASGALLGGTAATARTQIDREIYSGLDCTLETHVAALRHVQRMSHDNDVEPRLPDTLMALYKRALAAGHGADEIAALFEVLRPGD